MNKSHEYSLYSKISGFIAYTEKYIINNISSNKRHLRIKLIDEIYSLPRYMFYSSFSKGNVRIKYLTRLQVTISMIDMLFMSLRDVASVSNHNLNCSISCLGDIKNIVYGWKLKEEKK